MATNVLTPYTQEPWAANSVIFPDHRMQLLDNFVNTLGLSILSYCFARRTYHDDLLTIHGLWSLSWPRVTIIMTFLTSWIFVLSSSILVSGVGLSYTISACRVSIYLCIVFYCISKLFLYCFLVEKVYVVWSVGKTTRFKSPVYRLCALVIILYIGVIILMFVGHISEFRHDGVCVIGLRPLSSIPLLSYDLFVNVFLTAMFVFPLARSGFTNPRLRSVSSRSLFAATAALTTSSVNIAILTAMQGRQLGWVCLASCCTDVTINALVLFWVTSPGSSETFSSKSLNNQNKINAIMDNLPTPHDDNNRRLTMCLTTFDPSGRSTTVGHESSADNIVKPMPDLESSTKGKRGARRWLGKLGSRDEGNSGPMKVQVTIMTQLDAEEGDLEMFENPGDRYAASGELELNGEGKLVYVDRR